MAMALTLIMKTTKGGRLLMYSLRFSRGLMLNMLLLSCDMEQTQHMSGGLPAQGSGSSHISFR